jgi:hypothetical protein
MKPVRVPFSARGSFDIHQTQFLGNAVEYQSVSISNFRCSFD